MRAEVKVGLIVGLVIFCGTGIWWVNRGENPKNDIPFDRAEMEKTAGDVALADDAVPIATAPKTNSPAPRTSPGAHQPTLRPERRNTTVIRPPGAHASSETPPAIAAGDNSEPLSAEKPEVEPAGELPGSLSGAKDPDEGAKGPPPSNAGPISDPAQPNAATVEKDTPAPRIIAPPRRETVANPATETPASGTRTPPATPRKKYVIKPGDRLIDIAEYEYDDGDLWKAIKAANPKLDENRLLVGTTIELPSRAEAETLMRAASEAAAPRPPTEGPPPVRPAANSTATTYVVGHGDTLIKIARNTLGDEERWREIYELNRDKLESPDVIQLGMKLKLPPKTKPAAGEDRG